MFPHIVSTFTACGSKWLSSVVEYPVEVGSLDRMSSNSFIMLSISELVHYGACVVQTGYDEMMLGVELGDERPTLSDNRL